jgi:hypothetical protein
VIIEPGSSPDQSRQINHLPPDRILAKDRLLTAAFFALILTAFVAPGPADGWSAGWWVFVGLVTLLLNSFITLRPEA